MSFEQPDFQPNPVRRALTGTWPLFRAFRTDVRMHWSLALWPVFTALALSNWMSLADAVLWGVVLSIGEVACVYTHEMGHVSMGRRCGVDTQLVTLSALGGLAHLDSEAQNPRDEIKIALAGPATHLLWLAVLWPLSIALHDAHAHEIWYWMLDGFRAYQVALLVFNLLPIYPMDGGRVLRGLLSFRLHANRASLHAATVGFVGNGAFIVLGLLSFTGLADPLGYGRFGVLLLFLGLRGIQACRGLRMQAQYGEIYAAHDPFAAVLLQSKFAADSYAEEERRERDERRAAREAREALQARVDELLDRANEVGGVERLTAAERRELERASRELAKG